MRMNQEIHPSGSSTAEQCADCARVRGCRPCFEELVRRFQLPLLHFLMRRVGSRHDAEDLLQETFLMAYRKIGRYRSSWRFSTWLFTIGYRLMVSLLRKRREPLDNRVVATEPVNPADSAEETEIRSSLWDTAQEVLDIEAYTALWLRYVESMEAGQIGQVIGRNANAVRILMHRARVRLGEALNQRGLCPEWCHEQE